MAVLVYLKGQANPVRLDSGAQVSWHHAQASGGGSFTYVLLQVKNVEGTVMAEFAMAELAGYEIKAQDATSQVLPPCQANIHAGVPRGSATDERKRLARRSERHAS